MRYDYRRKSLYSPGRVSAFADRVGVPSFDYTEHSYSLTNAWWLAQLCHASYYDQARLGAALAQHGITLAAFFDAGGTQGYLATTADYAVLAFRGLQFTEIEDVLAVVEIVPSSVGGANVAHRGFVEALDHVWGDVQAALQPVLDAGTPVWFTGHSLGGALATLAASRTSPTALYTFAAPCVGNSAFASSFTGFTYHRFVNCCDFVPDFVLPALAYEHAGEFDFLTSAGGALRSPSSDQVHVEQRAGRAAFCWSLRWLMPWNALLRSTADHNITNYGHALRAALP